MLEAELKSQYGCVTCALELEGVKIIVDLMSRFSLILVGRDPLFDQNGDSQSEDIGTW